MHVDLVILKCYETDVYLFSGPCFEGGNGPLCYCTTANHGCRPAAAPRPGQLIDLLGPNHATCVCIGLVCSIIIRSSAVGLGLH